MEAKRLKVCRIENQGDRLIIWGSDPNYHIIADSHVKVAEGDEVVYEPYGCNFGWFVSIAERKMSPIQILLDNVDWCPIALPMPTEGDGLPFATHTGILELEGVKFKVYQLSNGQRVIDAKDLENFFAGPEA